MDGLAGASWGWGQREVGLGPCVQEGVVTGRQNWLQL